MLKVTVNDTSFGVQLKKNETFIDDELWKGDLVKIGENLFHMIRDSKTYTIELLSIDKKELQIRINGVNTLVVIQDKYDLLLEKLGMEEANDTRHKEVRAPMPGMILDILVEKGQMVARGDKLLILEAMKMENIIKSAGEGTVESVTVEKGMSVEKNQILIQF